MCGISVFIGVRHTPLKLRDAGPSVHQILGTSYMGTHMMRNSNQILHGDQTRCEEDIYRFDHTPCPGKIFGDTNADARSVCGS